ncbi:PrsW family intramembrane metalloprotease [Tessaracoccus sp. HDW20]|uniref:PrsW family intramembrane metalloprotease n=1 Tax=Tessaracoccus coleopterorum TaxID=2714950 RepID=UPI0018D2C930|nr:PrsW family intramembrane metalloprotease [Tessaracoccus coleopterorum]NHB85623.1 PrsW family intramembrane metalloprotease [Tessaracoccus coleopterorum]
MGTAPRVAPRRKAQAFVVPLIAVILGALGTLIGMLVVLDRPPVASFLSVSVFSLVALLGVWFLTWLDRWEPEPPLFTVGAFLWGAGVSALISGIVNTVYLAATGDMEATAMYSAPFIEETTKALFLVLVLLTSRRGRAEFNSLTDAIVYGGMVGLGFSWIENIGYALQPGTVGESLQMIVVRLLLVAFLHPMLTIVVSIGIWLGLNVRGAMRIVFPFAFWCLAVALHFLHNASTTLFGGSGFLMTAGIEVLLFTGLIVIGVSSRNWERATVREQLPVMVHLGWLTPFEAGWLADLGARKAVLAEAGPARAQLTGFVQNTTELALLRGRLGRDRSGQPPSEWLQLHRELVGLIIAQRGEVDRALGPSPSWRPVAGRPGDNFGTYPHRS